MRFIWAVLFVLTDTAARALRVINFIVTFAAAAVTITAFVLSYGTGETIYNGLSPEYGQAAFVPALGAAFGICATVTLLAAFVIAISRAVSATATQLATWVSKATEEAFEAKASKVEAELEARVTVEAPVERKPNRRMVPRRDDDIAASA